MQTRNPAARAGIALLNLFAPGVGLLRVGKLRRALTVFGTWVGAYLLFVAALASTRTMTFSAYAAVAGTFLLIVTASVLTSIWWTWREGRYLPSKYPVWSRWYSVIGAVIAAHVVSWVLSDAARTFYRNFYVPSEAMEPTLVRNDRFVASMRRPETLQRGDVILVKTDSGDTYVKRLAALPGDKIAMKNGTVFLNGRAAALKASGVRAVSYPYVSAKHAHLYSERLMGESSAHLIQDLGPSAVDNMREIEIPPAHVFVLGDNRDNSADSRVPAWQGGLELVPFNRLVGRPLFYYWPYEKMGRSVTNSIEGSAAQSRD